MRVVADDAPARALPDGGAKVLSLRVIEGPATGTQRSLERPFVVGRGEVDLDLADPSVSRRHARITVDGATASVTDLGSARGTFVGMRRTTGPQPLRAGDRLHMGDSVLLVLEHHRRAAPSASPDGLVLTLVGPGGEQVLGGTFERLRIGRDRTCDIVVDDARVSRVHAELRASSSGLVVEDVQSTNGTAINGRPLRGRHRIVAGDVIDLGGSGTVVCATTTAGAPMGSVAVTVVVEGSARGWAVSIDAPDAATTVADVTATLAEYLGFEPAEGTVTALDRGLGLYVRGGGRVLHPADRWCDVGVARADTIVLAPLPPPAGDSPDAGPAADAARVTVNQLPRTQFPPAPVAIDVPSPPDGTSLRGRGVQWQIAAGLAAVCAGLLIAVVRPGYAVFALIGGVVGLVTTAAGVLGEQSRRRHQVHVFRERVAAVDADLAAAQSSQSAALRAVSPEVDELGEWVRVRSGRLWERRAGDSDFLRLRIGTGTLRLRTERPLAVGDGGPVADELRTIVQQRSELTDVPVTSPGLGVRVVGVAGDRRRVAELGARLLIEAATVHSPHDLSIAVVATNEDWAWARWLPHAETPDQPDVAFDIASATALAGQLQAPDVRADRRAAPRTRFVLVAHGALSVGAVERLVQTGLPGGGQIVVLADHVHELPSEAQVVVEIGGERAAVRGAYADAPAGAFTAAGVSVERAEELAEALARLVDPRRPAARRGDAGGVLELLGVGRPETVDVERLWSVEGGTGLSAMVGTSDDGTPLALELRRDGPHGLIAGTTGSGKSELLQTLLAVLATKAPPTRLNLFLIDFKGGATFAALSRLPHVVGLVTDLEQDRSLAERAFTSLDAEIARRKVLLDEAHCRDILEYERLPEAGTTPLPNLVVAIDEFALLVREQPEVKRRLDTVATQGRSLGVHLVLATQSPAGVITEAIRTNTNMWVCLRVVDESSSSEVLGRPDAAHIPVDAPGRALLRRGAGSELTVFQTARIARPVGDSRSARHVSIVPYSDIAPSGRSRRIAPEPEGRSVTELGVLVNRLSTEAERLGWTRPKPLWLPPLPSVVASDHLPGGTHRDGDRLVVCLGLVDEPEAQRQATWWIDLSASGNALVLGVLGSGKSTTLTQIGLDLAEHYAPGRLHLYGVEAGGGSLAAVARLPHTAGVVGCGDRERLVRLLARLTTLVERRRERMAASGVGDFLRWRSTREAPEPWVVLLVDDFPALREAGDAGPGPSMVEQLASLAQNGPSVGVHVIVASTQASDLRMAFTNLFGARVLLRQADAVDYHLLELRLSGDRVPVGPPGRGTVAGGRQVQVAAPTDERIAEAAGRWSTSPSGAPRPIERLPRDIRLVTVLDRRPPARRELVLGVGGAEVEPIVVDQQRVGPHLLVMGDNQTGRSTTLLTCYESLLAADPEARFVVLAPRPSPLRDLVGAERVAFVGSTRDELDGGLAVVSERAGASTVLLLDDAEAASGLLSDGLERALREARDTELRTCIAVRSADFARLFDGWARYLQTLRTGLVLMPTGEPAFAFETRLPAATAPMSPGRGCLVDRGAIDLVQVATPMRGALP